MEMFITIAIALLGAIVASFAGVIAARLHTGQSSVTGHSRCDACDKELSAHSLVPIVSFIASRGRAQCCGARISPASPITEIVLAAVFALSFRMLGLGWELLFLLIAATLLLALVLYDLEHQILPSELLYPFVGVSAVVSYLHAVTMQEFLTTVLIAACVGGSLAVVHIVSRGRAMGLADAPLALGLALLVGSSALTGFIFSFWIGAVVGIVLLLGRPKGSRMGVEVPFAPFLACGFLLAYFTQWNLFTYIAALH